jgi:DNA polymerase III sliding clamp (beta) subunit (PCNA family)
MTFLSLSQKDFQKILNLCNQISPKKSDIEVFTFTKIELSSGELHLSSINSTVFYSTKLKPQNIDNQASEFKFLIKTDVLAASAALINDEIIGLEVDMDKLTLVVVGAKSKHTLRLNIDLLDDFVLPEPNPEEVDGVARTLASDLAGAIKVALTTVGQPKSVYQTEFLSVCLTIRPEDNQLALASSDKYRISRTYLVANLDKLNQESSQEPMNFLLNPRALQLISGILAGPEEVVFRFEKSFCWVELDGHHLTLRYGAGQFPDYEKIIPQSFACSFSLNTKDFLEALRQVYLSARANAANKSVTLNVNPANGKILFKAKTDEGYSSEASLDIAAYEGMQEPWNQAFNADYLMDYVNIVTAENILVESNPGKPLVMSPENEKNKQLCLVQGLR